MAPVSHLSPTDTTPVQIMPKPRADSSPPSSSTTVDLPVRKKRRVDRRKSPSSPTLSPSPSPPPLPSRKRAPTLERLPRWLFLPRRHFVAAHGALPLPRKVAVRGKPFYDWDAWAVALLSPNLWCRRGPWHRLIACCTAAKPPHVDLHHVPDVKAALVRIVVAEVVSHLVGRSGESLTPEDRNWITSVASRQRGRHARKPTLILLLDLAFAVFDVAAFCRRSTDPSTNVRLQTKKNVTDHSNPSEKDRITAAIQEIVSNACTFPSSQQPGKPANNPTQTGAVDPVVLRVLDVVHTRPDGSSNTWIIGNVTKAIDVIENLLTSNNARRWHHYFTSKADAARDGVTQAAKVFAHRMPLSNVKSVAQLREDPFSPWLLESLQGGMWVHWAELANDCNYIILTGLIPEDQVREMACRSIVRNLIANSQLSVDSELLDLLSTEQMQYDDSRLTVRRILDMALGLEQVYSFFVETYANDAAIGSCITWGVLYYEGLVVLLAGIRTVLVAGSCRELAMIDWSVRSLDISNYYREALFGSEQMCEDVNRAIQSAFSEASWMPFTRAVRYMVQPVSQTKVATKGNAAQMACFWVASLDLTDPVYLATAIVPWDPQRALKLIDKAIGLSKKMMKDVCEGKEGVPLWDFRRISLCRLLTFRGNPHQTSLIMERLQPLFDQRSLHEGGNFSASTIPLLEAAEKEQNFCAQTTHGLLLAGKGAYWEVARSWANCKVSVVEGMRKLYSSAEAGDLEACTALSHIWAQGDRESADVFRNMTLEQVYKLFKIAVTSQNAKAVMNMGAIWRYGNCWVQANSTVATDAFLMALQGGVCGEARPVAARHLAETIGHGQSNVAGVLSLLTRPEWEKASSGNGVYRVDNLSKVSL